MEDQAHENGLGNETIMTHRPCLEESEHGETLHNQGAQASSKHHLAVNKQTPFHID